MKTICKLKLSDLNKSNIEKREMSRLYGGNFCAYGDENSQANDTAGKCSCLCDTKDYYDGLNSTGSFYKYMNQLPEDSHC